jgi:hypothetical protein
VSIVFFVFRPGVRLRDMLRRAASIAILIAAVWVTFAPAIDFSFLNWDDNLVIVDNAALGQPGLVRWAFTTTYMEHLPAGELAALGRAARNGGARSRDVSRRQRGVARCGLVDGVAGRRGAVRRATVATVP